LEQFESNLGDAWLFVSKLFDREHPEARWAVAVRVPEATQHVPAGDVGVDFRDRVEGAVVDSFLTCLRVVRSTPVIAPLPYPGTVRGGVVTITGEATAYFGETAEPPRCEWPSPFTQGDLAVISEVWSGMVKVRCLREWMSQPFDERTFTDLDRKAVTKAREGLHRFFAGLLQDAKGEGEEAYRARMQVFEQLIQKWQDEKDEWWQDEYRTSFFAVFRQYQDKLFNSESRVGRALGIFESGIHLPPVHAFLSACLVLETLFTVDTAEVAHKMATRMTKILLPDAGIAERRELYKRIKKMYRGRSEVIHGSKSIYRLNEEVRQSALEFAQRSLQAILRQDKLVRLYTQNEKGERAEGGLLEFFEALDLG